MSNEPSTSPDHQAAVAAGETLLAILRRHVDLVATGRASEDDAEEIDRALWEAVGDYGNELDAQYDDDDESDLEELTFTVRTRYDYTVVDEKAFLSSGQGIGQAVQKLIDAAGKPIGALEVDSLETGSGLLTVHLNNEPLVSADFQSADEPTDLLLIAPNESLAFVLDEPVYDSRADAEAAAKREV